MAVVTAAAPLCPLFENRHRHRFRSRSRYRKRSRRWLPDRLKLAVRLLFRCCRVAVVSHSLRRRRKQVTMVHIPLATHRQADILPLEHVQSSLPLAANKVSPAILDLLRFLPDLGREMATSCICTTETEVMMIISTGLPSLVRTTALMTARIRRMVSTTAAAVEAETQAPPDPLPLSLPPLPIRVFPTPQHKEGRRENTERSKRRLCGN